jgi:predicted nucleic acid-binding protein
VSVSFDTNVLVYAADKDAGHRHRRAVEIVGRAILSRSGILALQALGEFFHVVTRKVGLDNGTAMAFIEGWLAVMPVQCATDRDLIDAGRVVRDHGLPFWDAMLWAAVRSAGVRYLLTEDLQDGRVLEGVTFVNPFSSANGPLVDTLLPPSAG